MSPSPAPTGRRRTRRSSRAPADPWRSAPSDPWRSAPSDPWRNAPTSELQDQVLPRWFVLLGLALVPIALAVLVAAFVVPGFDEVAPEARRPPPAGGLSHAVGELVVAPGEAQALDGARCGLVTGIRVGGTASERQRLETGLQQLCAADLPGPTQARVRRFAQAGGAVRFAAFQASGVDSAAVLDVGALPADTPPGDGPLVLVNARFAQLEPWRIAPLVLHDLTLREEGPEQATAAVLARQAELAACEALASGAGGRDDGRDVGRACDDARAVLALPDPAAALRDVGYR